MVNADNTTKLWRPPKSTFYLSVSSYFFCFLNNILFLQFLLLRPLFLYINLFKFQHTNNTTTTTCIFLLNRIHISPEANKQIFPSKIGNRIKKILQAGKRQKYSWRGIRDWKLFSVHNVIKHLWRTSRFPLKGSFRLQRFWCDQRLAQCFAVKI